MNRISISNLAFSQNNLQDFVDCNRRFQLRHMMRLSWPAVESDPILENERLIQLGSQFHKMIQQYLIGVPVEAIASQIHDPDLSRWWENFISYFLADNLALTSDEAVRYFPEVLLSGYIGEFQFRAKYDLIVVHSNGTLTIYDWKTSRKRATRMALSERIQTRLYPCLLVKSGAFLLNGVVIQPEDVQLVYWFADFPDQPEQFKYDSAKFSQDLIYFSELLAQINGMTDSEFLMTPQIERCKYCVYRSYCQRGVEAGDLVDSSDDYENTLENLSSFDFDRIEELPY